MQDSGSLIALLATVTAISLTGVIAPGPVTAIAVTRGMERREAGLLIAVGHGIVEMPMIAIIWLGFATVMATPWARVAVGIAGGLVLVWMGIGMVRARPQPIGEQYQVARGCVLAGVTTTIANPYWLVWWATVGAALVASAGAWGLAGVAAFALTHWLCDAGWLSLLSWGVFKSRRFLTPAAQRGMLVVCGVVLVGFGVYFLGTGTHALIS